MRVAQLISVVVLTLVSCSSRSPVIPSPSQQPAIPVPQPATARTAPDVELLRTLAVLATTREPTATELDDTARALASGTLTIDRYIEGLVDSKEFADHVAPLTILRQYVTLEPDGYPIPDLLKRVEGATPLYYRGEKPCAVSTAKRVRPWWNLETEVLICPNDYKPEKWTTESIPAIGIQAGVCFSANASGTPKCGCGPNLIRCFESDKHQERVMKSMRAELLDTVSWVVSHDLPAETLFTSTSTFRDRSAEYMLRVEDLHSRQVADPAAELADLAAWPETGKWAPRTERGKGQHAGLLTSPLLMQHKIDRRQRMAAFYDLMWCAEQGAAGATPEAMMSLKGNNLQVDSSGWEELAQRTLCTNCHARLDYGMQFFWGYANGYVHSYYSPKLQQQGRGPLFGGSHDDPRGTAELNPRAFAEVAVAQPEFRTCMARNVAGYVLGNHLTPPRLEEITAIAKPGSTSIKALMRASLRALVDHWGEDRKKSLALPAMPQAAAGGEIAISPALAAQLQTHCLDCHEGDSEIVDLAKPQLPRATVIAALKEVAFGRMPQNAPLVGAERSQLIDAFVAAAWTGADAATARNYFENRMLARPAYRSEVMLDLIHQRTGAPPPPIRSYERHILSHQNQVTPSVGAMAGVAAIESCRIAKKDRPRAELDACIEKAIRLENLAIDARLKP